MKRRDFLGIAGFTATSLATGLPSTALAAGSGTTLVVVFQRGGCDGLNLLVPHGDPDYYALRPTIAIPRPGHAGGALDLDGTFGLHPRLSGLRPIYDQGNLALFPSVHYPYAERSHFEGQGRIESAVGDPDSGWLGRYLGEDLPQNPRALSMDNELPHSLAGARNVLSVSPSLDAGELAHERNQQFLDALAELYGVGGNDGAAHFNVVRNGRNLWQQMDLMVEISDDRAPANGAVYPGTAFGERLRRAAHAIRRRLGLEVITVDSTGWDTHSAQGGSNGRQAEALGELGDAMAAFWRDLGADGDGVVLLCMTEFGRTAAENASYGTDHGNASTWLTCGPAVHGGIYTGDGGWPGLSPQALHEGRDLAHTVDVRDVMAEVLGRHLGLSALSGVLPGYAPAPLGFL